MQRRWIVVFLLFATFAAGALAKDIYLSIGGSVGVFRTDMRILNPSPAKDIQVQAYLLRVGNADNSAVQPRTITVPKRQMVVYDDVVTSLFNESGLAAIRLRSDDEFVATQRIYAQAPNGTLGQFVPGLDSTTAKKNGVLIQLKSSASFRTNIGVVNPNAAAASVTWRLYDKNNALVATGTPIAMPPFAVIGPTNVASTFFFTPGSADLTDAWVSYTSDQPIFAYASVVDGGTTDPTFIPMSEDPNPPAAPQPPAAKTFTVTLRSGVIEVTPAMVGLRVGDVVTLRVSSADVRHGFQMNGPSGTVVASANYNGGAPPVDRIFTIPEPGTYTYFCTIVTCSAGHSSMFGTFNVESTTGQPGDRY